MAAGVRERQFLDPAVVARLGTLELKARTIVEGFLSGLHRSPFKGFSVEFAEYRQYIPGDDLATIDWKVYARSDRHYVKKFEEETNLDCHVVLDASGSMGLRLDRPHQARVRAVLAASLGYLMNRQRDAVGLTAFDDRITTMLPASARPGHLRAFLITLDRRCARARDRRRQAASSARRLADQARHGGAHQRSARRSRAMVDGLKHFQFRGTDVIVFHVLDPAELTFPFEQPARFRDSEGAGGGGRVRKTVRQICQGERRPLRKGCRRELQLVGIDYTMLETSGPLSRACCRTADAPKVILRGVPSAEC